jgi:hypothetical protein
MKNFFRVSLLAIIFLGSYGIYIITKRPTSLYPFPYILKNTNYSDLELAENADILIVGDRMAAGLDNVKSSLLKGLSKDFSTDLSIYNWAEENEGLHRTLDKLSSLKKYPGIIIYQGASREFYEEKFKLSGAGEFRNNLEKFKDPKTISAIMAYPLFSKFIYSYKNLIQLGTKPQKFQGERASQEMQKIFEIGYQLFELEMDKLVEMAGEKNFSLFLLTSPINLKVPPKEICSNSTTPSLENELSEISNLLKEGKSKESFERLNILGNSLQGNAKIYYLLGMSLENMGRFEDAALALNQGSAFDCYPWRSNIVFNNIIRSQSGKKNIFMVDFDRIVNQNFGIRNLFMDEIFPKIEFYDILGDEISPMIATIFKR